MSFHVASAQMLPNPGRTPLNLLSKLAVVAAIPLAMGASSEGCSSTTAAGEKTAGKSGKVGQAVNNAGTTYKVKSVKVTDRIGVPNLGGAKAEPGAKLVVVALAITNGKNETKTFTHATAKVKAGGATYQVSDETLLAFGTEQNLLMKDIQPGITANGKLAFELPTKRLPGSKLVIEDFFGNGNVTIDLGL